MVYTVDLVPLSPSKNIGLYDSGYRRRKSEQLAIYNGAATATIVMVITSARCHCVLIFIS